jgi:alpha-L-rhamnosidase
MRKTIINQYLKACGRKWLAMVILMAMSLQVQATLKVHHLLCEGLDNPLAIDNTNPHFSWQMLSDKPNSYQTAYQVMVASSEALLKEGKADLWNTGKVK